MGLVHGYHGEYRKKKKMDSSKVMNKKSTPSGGEGKESEKRGRW